MTILEKAILDYLPELQKDEQEKLWDLFGSLTSHAHADGCEYHRDSEEPEPNPFDAPERALSAFADKVREVIDNK